jgi:hypothetical protein
MNAFLPVLLMTGRENGENQDWTEEVMLTVAAEKVEFYPLENIGFQFMRKEIFLFSFSQF